MDKPDLIVQIQNHYPHITVHRIQQLSKDELVRQEDEFIKSILHKKSAQVLNSIINYNTEERVKFTDEMFNPKNSEAIDFYVDSIADQMFTHMSIPVGINPKVLINDKDLKNNKDFKDKLTKKK